MTSDYEPLTAPRFDVEQTADGEQVRIRPRRQIAAMIFLPIWLVVWTLGGGLAILSIPGDISPYTAIWIGFWGLGVVAVAASYAWMLAGSETIRVTGGDLEVTHAGLGLSRRWLYPGAQIRNLQVSVRPAAVSRVGGTVPFTRMNRTGSVKFDYGARTIYLAPGLEDAEGAMIVDRLASQLPASARA